jgi:hypothetical protein
MLSSACRAGFTLLGALGQVGSPTFQLTPTYSAFQLIMQVLFFLLKKYYRIIFTKYYFHSSANMYSQHYLRFSSNLFSVLGKKWLFYEIWLFRLITQVWQDIRKIHFKAVLCFIFPTFVSITFTINKYDHNYHYLK